MLSLRILALLAAVAAAAFALPGCSSDSETDTANDGLWEGRFDINGKGPYRFVALHVAGRAVGHSDDAKVILRGDVSIEDGQYLSHLDMFFMSGSPFDRATLQGTLAEPGRIKAHFRTHGAGDEGELNLRREGNPRKKASHEAITGPWILYRGFNILKLEIAGNGAISGGNTDGCAYDGEIKPASSDYNGYTVQLIVTSCDNLDGIWKGMAYLADSVEFNDTLNLHLFEADWAMLLPMVRNTGTRLIDEKKEWNP